MRGAASVAGALVVKTRPVGRHAKEPEAVTHGVGGGLLRVGGERREEQGGEEREGGFHQCVTSNR